MVLSTVNNALRVLEYLVEHGEAGISEMGRALGLSPGTVFRLVSTLMNSDFAYQNPKNRHYRPGTKVLELANTMRGRAEFLDLAHDHLERLQERASETVNLGVLRGEDVVYVDRVLSSQPLSVEVRIGSRVPAFCTALGKVMLAYGDPEDRERYARRLPSLATDTHKPPTRQHFLREMRDIEARGHAEDMGEFSPDIMCVAAPVINSRGQAVAAVSVSGPASRFKPRRESLIPMVEIAGKELTLLLAELGEDDPRL
jgi:DNA-binding IclR family transcriptional regulator